MIFIYGDSHAYNSFKGLKYDHRNCHQNAITMFRIGRDNIIINFNKDDIRENDILVLCYGEVDCRCHVQRQINTGRNEDDVIHELVSSYYQTIVNNINTIANKNVKIIMVGVIPPTKQSDYESLHGPILHDFPFVGSDEDRVRYTDKVNKKIEELAKERNFTYFNPYLYYTRKDGTLRYELSDYIVHLGNNSYFLKKFYSKILEQGISC
jgi:hypothetical protein